MDAPQSGSRSPSLTRGLLCRAGVSFRLPAAGDHDHDLPALRGLQIYFLGRVHELGAGARGVVRVVSAGRARRGVALDERDQRGRGDHHGHPRLAVHH
eukprot:3228450-Rhodomonas_salina.3